MTFLTIGQHSCDKSRVLSFSLAIVERQLEVFAYYRDYFLCSVKSTYIALEGLLFLAIHVFSLFLRLIAPTRHINNCVKILLSPICINEGCLKRWRYIFQHDLQFLIVD